MGAAEEIETVEPDEESILAEAQALLETRRREFAWQEPSAPVALAIPLPPGVTFPEGPPRFFCAGTCGGEVPRRGGYCDPCAEAQRQQMRALHLAAAYESISPGNAMAWCRAGSDVYAERTQRAVRATQNIANPTRRERAVRLIREAEWTPRWGNLLLIGPKRIGKTNTAIAISHAILDRALAGHLDAAGFAFARGLRLVTGLDLARARAKTKLGEDPRLIVEAERASILILDEIGFEDDRHDPHAVRDLIYARYRRGRKAPTIVTSGCTLDELSSRYGAAVERLTDLGEFVDLHTGAIR